MQKEYKKDKLKHKIPFIRAIKSIYREYEKDKLKYPDPLLEIVKFLV